MIEDTNWRKVFFYSFLFACRELSRVGDFKLPSERVYFPTTLHSTHCDHVSMQHDIFGIYEQA